MDREATARAHRRREATEALAAERERTAALQEEIDRLVAELEGAQVDEAAFAQMTEEDAEVVRSLLYLGGMDVDAEEEWLDEADEAAKGEAEAEELDPRAETEEEIARLEEEIAESRRRGQALERYLEALGS